MGLDKIFQLIKEGDAELSETPLQEKELAESLMRDSSLSATSESHFMQIYQGLCEDRTFKRLREDSARYAFVYVGLCNINKGFGDAEKNLPEGAFPEIGYIDAKDYIAKASQRLCELKSIKSVRAYTEH